MTAVTNGGGTEKGLMRGAGALAGLGTIGLGVLAMIDLVRTSSKLPEGAQTVGLVGIGLWIVVGMVQLMWGALAGMRPGLLGRALAINCVMALMWVMGLHMGVVQGGWPQGLIKPQEMPTVIMVSGVMAVLVVMAAYLQAKGLMRERGGWVIEKVEGAGMVALGAWVLGGVLVARAVLAGITGWQTMAGRGGWGKWANNLMFIEPSVVLGGLALGMLACAWRVRKGWAPVVVSLVMALGVGVWMAMELFMATVGARGMQWSMSGVWSPWLRSGMPVLTSELNVVFHYVTVAGVLLVVVPSLRLMARRSGALERRGELEAGAALSGGLTTLCVFAVGIVGLWEWFVWTATAASGGRLVWVWGEHLPLLAIGMMYMVVGLVYHRGTQLRQGNPGVAAAVLTAAGLHLAGQMVNLGMLVGPRKSGMASREMETAMRMYLPIFTAMNLGLIVLLGMLCWMMVRVVRARGGGKGFEVGVERAMVVAGG